ncbi:MAG: thioredoxin family protein [Candidatus Omnitrophica bacterium]|nr:thioredoxin family protein [Candidatus Omnitrophota bacterium]
MKDAAEACGIRKGMTRSELLEKMNTCVPEFYKQRKGEAMSEKKVIKVYHSPHCDSCHQAVDLLNKGRFESNIEGDVPVDLIDVTSDEGFREIGEAGVDAVPTAKYNGKTCKLGIDEEQQVVVITCDLPPEDQAEEQPTSED